MAGDPGVERRLRGVTPSARKVLIIDGHPDGAPERFCHALVDAYAEGATAAGHAVQCLRLAELDFPLLRTREAFESEPPPADIVAAQAAIDACDHLVLIYPLWMGSVPALLKGFLEQVFRPGFAMGEGAERNPWSGRLRDKSARVVVTMGMPGLVYLWFYRAHSLKSLERNILRFCGIAPVRHTVLGGVETATAARRTGWLTRMRELGARAR